MTRQEWRRMLRADRSGPLDDLDRARGLMLADLMRPDGLLEVRRSVIAARLGRSSETARRLIEVLVAAGYLEKLVRSSAAGPPVYRASEREPPF